MKVSSKRPKRFEPTREVKQFEPKFEFDTPRYVLGDAAAAAGISTSLLKAWITREPIVVPLGDYDLAGRGKGTPRLFTLRRVISIAITAEMVALGINPSRAGNLAFGFTDYEHEEGRYVELESPTYLIVEPKSTAIILAIDPKSTFDQVLKKTIPSSGEKPASFAVISGGAVKQRVMARLKKRGL
jgi:hypothetical protein